jgi:hypothetical protein
MGGVTGSVGEVAASARESVRQAPQAARRTAQGNPLMAGALAFGVGFLVASVMPKTDTEQEAAGRLADDLEPVKESLGDAGQEVASAAREAGSTALEEAGSAASDAASELKEAASQATGHVMGDARRAAETVTGEASSQAESVSSETDAPTPTGM